jgi:hypothetical protein
MLIPHVTVLPYWTGIATLVAAALAALLSAISLFLTGRREDKRWKREVLQETLASLFDASFAYIDKAAFYARRDGKDVSWYKDRALDANAAQFHALTRLHFLANSQVLNLGYELHDVEVRLYDLVFKTQSASADWDALEETRIELEAERTATRKKLFNAARRNLGLQPTFPVDVPQGRGPSSEDRAIHEMERQRQEREIKQSAQSARSSPDVRP